MGPTAGVCAVSSLSGEISDPSTRVSGESGATFVVFEATVRAQAFPKFLSDLKSPHESPESIQRHHRLCVVFRDGSDTGRQICSFLQSLLVSGEGPADTGYFIPQAPTPLSSCLPSLRPDRAGSVGRAVVGGRWSDCSGTDPLPAAPTRPSLISPLVC